MFRGQPGEQRVAVGDAEQSVLHLDEVVDDEVDLGDRRHAPRAPRRRAMLGTATVDLDLGPRFDHARAGSGLVRGDAGQHAVGVALDGQRRVDEQVDAEAVPVEDEAHRVDEERHVLGDEQQDRAGRLPAVALEVGRQHLHEDLARLTPPSEAQVGVAGRVQVVACDDRRRRRRAARSSTAAAANRAARRRGVARSPAPRGRSECRPRHCVPSPVLCRTGRQNRSRADLAATVAEPMRREWVRWHNR